MYRTTLQSLTAQYNTEQKLRYLIRIPENHVTSSYRKFPETSHYMVFDITEQVTCHYHTTVHHSTRSHNTPFVTFTSYIPGI